LFITAEILSDLLTSSSTTVASLTTTMNPQSPVPIAVIGMSCRFPGGASSPEKLWDLLSEGRSAWSETPTDRWTANSFYHPHNEAREAITSKSGYFLEEDIATFDPKFFNISGAEAEAMDPQQRLLLETTYEALENAGIPLDGLKGSDTSVYTSVFARDYDRMIYKDIPLISKWHITGCGDAILSNRISYWLDLRGSSITIDTGCSGSIAALHRACQSLRTMESSLSIVGGAQLVLSPEQQIPLSMAGYVTIYRMQVPN
jgi:acyl transferase domain-containing protein